MKISIAQLNYIIGDFEGNTHKIIEAMKEGVEQGADIICFGELSTCGYPPRDFLEFDDFIRNAQKAVDKIIEASKTIKIGAVIGTPTVNPKPEGKDLFNSLLFIEEGMIKHTQHKALLPTYDIFDEYRYFEPGNRFEVMDYKGQKIAFSICEDIWDVGTDNPLYNFCPLDILKEQNPDFIINISASPFDFNHAQARIDILKENVKRYNIPMFYTNHVGAQTEIIFDGGSLVINSAGHIVKEMPYFESAIETFDLEAIQQVEEDNTLAKDKIALIHDGLVCGIKDYFGKLGFKKAILGLSGGIDSAVSTVLAVRALGPENVRVLLMPSQFSSDHSIKDAEDLAKNLGITYDIVEIKDIYATYMSKLKPLFEGKPFNVTEENLQARSRGMLLMALSNKFGNILLNTSNKSEMAVGYGTLYGDLCGGLSVIADVYKTDVFKLAEYMNKDGVVVPTNTINKPPSAELRPDQKDSDSLPDYDVLDAILFEYIENQKGPKAIIALGYDPQLVKRILRLVNINEFKRYQTAPALRVSTKAFGMGRRVPIVGRYLS